jgi:hypothetical protein
LTVSSQLRNPISTGARVLDIFFEMWAITVVAALAGSLGSFFTHKHHLDMRDKEVASRPQPGGQQH